MKKTILLSAVILFLAGWLFCPQAGAAPTVTITATSTTLLGVSVPISLDCKLVDPGQTGVLRAGTSVIVNLDTTTVTPGITATCGPVWANDSVTDGFGNTNSTYYIVSAFTVSGNGIIASTPSMQQAYQFAGSGTFDLATTLPFSLGPVSPAGSVLGMNLTFTGIDNATGLWNFTGGLQNNGVAVPVLPINLATQVTGTLPGANYAAVNLAAGNVNGGVTGVLPGANMAATNLAGGNNPGGVSGVLPVANEGTGTPSAGTYVDGATGAWTAIPATGVQTIYKTTTTKAAASLGTTTMVTPGRNTIYKFNVRVTQTVATLSCSVQPSMTMTLAYTDADNNVAISTNPGVWQTGNLASALTITMTFAQTTLTGAVVWMSPDIVFNAKSGVAVTIATTYSAGTSCSPGASYAITPVLLAP